MKCCTKYRLIFTGYYGERKLSVPPACLQFRVNCIIIDSCIKFVLLKELDTRSMHVAKMIC